MKRRNFSAATLFLDERVSTMSSPPTTLMLPPGPAGTGAVATLNPLCAFAKIGSIHGPSRIVAYFPSASPFSVPVAPWSPVIRLGIAPCL
jgi:hypothetical protein